MDARNYKTYFDFGTVTARVVDFEGKPVQGKHNLTYSKCDQSAFDNGREIQFVGDTKFDHTSLYCIKSEFEIQGTLPNVKMLQLKFVPNTTKIQEELEKNEELDLDNIGFVVFSQTKYFDTEAESDE